MTGTTPRQEQPRPEAVRRSQEARSAQTKSAINEATVRCLIAEGYAGTTLNAVQRSAGISRGAITHHFGSKQQMLIAAIDHLAAGREQELSQAAPDLPEGEGRVRAVIALIWGSFKDDLFYAALELWVAARADEKLREELFVSERQLGGRHRRLVADLFGADISTRPGYARAYDALFNLMRGAALIRILRDDADSEDDEVDGWAETFLLMTATTKS